MTGITTPGAPAPALDSYLHQVDTAAAAAVRALAALAKQLPTEQADRIWQVSSEVAAVTQDIADTATVARPVFTVAIFHVGCADNGSEVRMEWQDHLQGLAGGTVAASVTDALLGAGAAACVVQAADSLEPFRRARGGCRWGWLALSVAAMAVSAGLFLWSR